MSGFLSNQPHIPVPSLISCSIVIAKAKRRTGDKHISMRFSLTFFVLAGAAVLDTCSSLQLPTTGKGSRRSDFAGNVESSSTSTGRRAFLSAAMATIGTGAFAVQPSHAEKLGDVVEGEGNTYENPNIPAGPEERSGLVVLRVAEVAQFQEKILRAVVNGDLPDVTVSPQQIVFGTKILLKNSNLACNMRLMIDQEVPRQRRAEASRNAATCMNTLQEIYTTADNIQRPFNSKEMILIADLYRDVRIQLNSLYEYLPQKEKDKYYGYFVAVTEYEKKIAEGVYNPDVDGVLKFD